MLECGLTTDYRTSLESKITWTFHRCSFSLFRNNVPFHMCTHHEISILLTSFRSRQLLNTAANLLQFLRSLILYISTGRKWSVAHSIHGSATPYHRDALSLENSSHPWTTHLDLTAAKRFCRYRSWNMVDFASAPVCNTIIYKW